MSGRRTGKHLAKRTREQQAAPPVFDKPHFLFDRESDLPKFGEHQLCSIFYDGHFADLKLAEWELGSAAQAPASIDAGDLELELEPQS